MNDAAAGAISETQERHRVVVRPRDAASLILLRGAPERLEVLVGRRSAQAKFMPNVYVFPGGRIDAPDRRPWSVETGADSLAPRLLRGARAALRETWEEVGVLFGRPTTAPTGSPSPAEALIERAYREHGLTATIERLTYVGRAITPSHSRRRFNTRFFVGDGGDVFGEPRASDELDDAGWHPVAPGLVAGFADVTRFMLNRAIAMRGGTAGSEPPLFYWAKNARRLGICREARS